MASPTLAELNENGYNRNRTSFDVATQDGTRRCRSTGAPSDQLRSDEFGFPRFEQCGAAYPAAVYSS